MVNHDPQWIDFILNLSYYSFHNSSNYDPYTSVLVSRHLKKFQKLPPSGTKKGTHRPEVGESGGHRGLKMFVKVIHWGSWFSLRSGLVRNFEIRGSQGQILAYNFIRSNFKIFTVWALSLKNRLQTTPWAELRPPMDWFCASFEPLTTS